MKQTTVKAILNSQQKETKLHTSTNDMYFINKPKSMDKIQVKVPSDPAHREPKL